MFSLALLLLYLAVSLAREREMPGTLARERPGTRVREQQEPGTLATAFFLLSLFFSSLLPEPDTAG